MLQTNVLAVPVKTDILISQNFGNYSWYYTSVGSQIHKYISIDDDYYFCSVLLAVSMIVKCFMQFESVENTFMNDYQSKELLFTKYVLRLVLVGNEWSFIVYGHPYP
jgi:hypothetical protein